MRATFSAVLLGFVLCPLQNLPSTAFAQDERASEPGPQQTRRLLQSYGNLPLVFEANQGQTDEQVKYISRAAGHILFLTTTEAVLAFRTSTGASGGERSTWPGQRHDPQPIPVTEDLVRIQFVGANPDARLVGLDELPGKVNYFIGNDPAQWRTGVPTFAKVEYEAVYAGIDLVFYGNEQQLEFDFVVEPGADPGVIRLAFEGHDDLEIDDHGNLVLHTSGGQVRLRNPLVYQEIAGRRQTIAGRYVVTNENQVGFTVAEYDERRPLIIDPVLVYSSILGGSGTDGGGAIGVDAFGNAYVFGSTRSTDFPLAAGPGPGTPGDLNMFVVKVNREGTALLYSTYLGGSGTEAGRGFADMAVDADGNAYVTSRTDSLDFPVLNPFQALNAGGFDSFVTKLDPSGLLLYSTYLGGSGREEGTGVALDASGSAYVTGETTSADFPTAGNPFQPTKLGFLNAYVTKLSPAGSMLIYSSFLGAGLDHGRGIAVDESGSAYVAGVARTTEFPTLNAFQSSIGGPPGQFPRDAFVTKFSPNGQSLVYSTYLGGSGNESFSISIAVDENGSAYVASSTTSLDFPLASPLQPLFGGAFDGGPDQRDAFVTKFSPDGSSLIYSTYLGGDNVEQNIDIAVRSGIAYVSGGTRSTNFPTTSDAIFPDFINELDAFVTQISPDGSTLIFSTYLGGGGVDVALGIAVDDFGNAYITGTSQGLPTTPGVFQPTPAGGGDAFVAKIGEAVIPVAIDIKPGSFPNSINLGSGGVVPVAILSTESFDASSVDPFSITLADAAVRIKGKSVNAGSLTDVDNDGDLDLVIQVVTEQLQLTDTDVEAVLTGVTFGGTAIIGSDTVRIVP